MTGGKEKIGRVGGISYTDVILSAEKLRAVGPGQNLQSVPHE
jgi:hypothetical protein